MTSAWGDGAKRAKIANRVQVTIGRKLAVVLAENFLHLLSLERTAKDDAHNVIIINSDFMWTNLSLITHLAPDCR